MNTIALRFADTFAPECGTIKAHQNLINETGYVWFGKLGSKISINYLSEQLKKGSVKILLIHSGKAARYWLIVDKIQNTTPSDVENIPSYYRKDADKFGSWLRVLKIEEAPSNIMSRCIVSSSGTPLGEASKSSMSPYFKITVEEE